MAALKVRAPTIKRRVAAALTKPSNIEDPIVHAVQAYFKPFDAQKGLASALMDGRPSQKFVAKAQTQVTLAAGQMMCFMTCPNVAANGDYASTLIAVGPSTGGLFTTNGTWKNLTVGDQVGPFGSITRISTSTPYRANVLAAGYEYACVGAGLKFTYEGSELYRGGTMRYIFDREHSYNASVDWTTDTVNGLIEFVNSSANTVRQSINKENVVEINTSPTGYGYFEADTVTSTAYSVSGDCAFVGGTTATTYFGIRPTAVGYYVNTSGNSISFHVDVVEHWCMSYADIQSLQTPSYASAPMATHVTAVMDNVRQAHAGSPNTHHATVASTVLKAMKSPIGHEILNAGIRAALA